MQAHQVASGGSQTLVGLKILENGFRSTGLILKDLIFF